MDSRGLAERSGVGLEGGEKKGAKEGCSAGNGSEIGPCGWVNRPYLRAGMEIRVLCVFRLLVSLGGQDLGFDGVQCAQYPTVLPADLPLKLLPLVRNHLEHVPEACMYTHTHSRYIPVHTHTRSFPEKRTLSSTESMFY